MRKVHNVIVGFVVGLAGGLIGLGGAELRLPYLVGILGLSPHQAVPINLAISMFTILAAIPARLLNAFDTSPAFFGMEAVAILLGAVIAAYLGASRLRYLSPEKLSALIFILLLSLGVGLLIEAGFALDSDGFLPAQLWVRLLCGVGFGLIIGAISSLLGVAGGEVIIPTLVFGYGAPVKAAGTLSLIISVPTVAVGIVKHTRLGAYSDRALMMKIVVPMAAGSIGGAVAGGIAAAYVPSAAVKFLLGVLLIWSAWKVFGHRR